MEFKRAEFTPQLIIGQPAIDKQHAEYINRLNNFIDKCEKGIDKDEIFEALDFLISYAGEHFESEEYLMSEKKFPGLENQRTQHGYFLDEIFKREEELKADGGFNEENLEKLFNLANNWFIQHIKTEDIKIANYINSM